MKKEPDYLFVGNGKLARHFSHYFDLLGIPYKSWSRNLSISFNEIVTENQKILVLIPDDAIEQFILEESSTLKIPVKWIHCSGALLTELAYSAHPLMTFGNELYDLDTYKNVTFVTETNKPSFKELFPELTNHHEKIEQALKVYYHAWCSIAGNFTTILWSNFFDRLENDFGLKKESAFVYLDAIAHNLKNSRAPLTGPIARKDITTIKKHIEALGKDNFKNIYESFVKLASINLNNIGTE